MAAIGLEQAALYGLSTNKDNEVYNRGFNFDMVNKLSTLERLSSKAWFAPSP
jgi:hypothetical protein